MDVFERMDRRQWLRTSAALSLATAGGIVPGVRADQSHARATRPRVALVLTEFTYRSHAHVIVENFLEPYYFNGKLTESGMEIVSFYVDQFPEGRDMARDVAKRYGIQIFPTIAEALTLGGKELAVDGVVSIGEHGDYPMNERQQRMYPRKRFFDEIVAVFRQSGRSVPVFSDKHLSYRWDWAAEMDQVAKELQFPLMAGSSVPLAQRRPPLEMPVNAEIEEAVSIHSGGIESYDFHALEVLQSMVESRRGGETGVSEVHFLEGDEVWKAADEGRWSPALALAAMSAAEGKEVTSLKDFIEPGTGSQHPIHAILVKYRDGLRGTMLRVGASSTRWCFACRVAGRPDPLATSFYVGPWQNRNLFKALSHSIQTLIREQRSPYPVERTLLTTGVLAAAMDSHYEKNIPVPTPHLDVKYSAVDFTSMREMGETWKFITDQSPEPKDIDLTGRHATR